MQDPFRNCSRLPFDIWAKILNYLIPHEEWVWNDDAEKRDKQICQEWDNASLPFNEFLNQNQKKRNTCYEKWGYRRSFVHYVPDKFGFSGRGVDHNIVRRFILFAMYLYREYGEPMMDDRYNWIWDQACSLISTETHSRRVIDDKRDFIISKKMLVDILTNKCNSYCRGCTFPTGSYDRLYTKLELEKKEPRPLCDFCTAKSIPKVDVKHLYKYGLFVRDLEGVPRFGDRNRFFYLPHILERSKKTGKRKRDDAN